MIEIKDPVLKRLLLEHLIEQMEQGGLDQLLESGVWPEVLDSLRQRTARDLLQVSIMDIKLGFDVDSAGVMEAFTRLDAVRRDNELKEYFVIVGAAPQVMAKLFKLTADQIRVLRDVLCTNDRPTGGRPRLPEIRVREQIHHSWCQLAQEQPEASLKERLYQMHQQHREIPINSLWAVLNEFDSLVEWDHAQTTTKTAKAVR